MPTNFNQGTNRNSAGGANVVSFFIGISALLGGLYLSSITQINLLTGHTTNPYLGVGIPLAIGGLVLMAIARAAAKRRLVK